MLKINPLSKAQEKSIRRILSQLDVDQRDHPKIIAAIRYDANILYHNLMIEYSNGTIWLRDMFKGDAIGISFVKKTA